MEQKILQRALVVGEDPHKLLYPLSVECKAEEPYLKYKKEKANYLFEKAKRVAKVMSENSELTMKERMSAKALLKKYENMTAKEYFLSLADGMILKDGDIYSDMNPDPKFLYYNKVFKENLCSIPFKTLDGKETYQARMKDIDWSEMHMKNEHIYRRAWELVVEKDTPKNEEEEQIFNAMQYRTEYFKKFETKERYVIFSSAFWMDAYLDENIGWVTLEDGESDIDWANSFYESFVTQIPEDALLTIVEYKPLP